MIEVMAGSAAHWLWEKFGPVLIRKNATVLQKKWEHFHWAEAEKKYRERLFDQTNTIRLLGNPKPIEIDAIYTDVHVLDERTAFRKFDLSAQTSLSDRDNELRSSRTRTRADDLLATRNRLYLLGKPGAGKTTFLKHLALQACRGEIAKTPILISLKEWSDSGEPLDNFIANIFGICGFPDAKEFIGHVLSAGQGLVLLDGLDEVNQEGAERNKMILSLERMAKKYPKSAFCITCRIAASDYDFDAFDYVEIADFDSEQQLTFIERWYQDSDDKKQRFLTEWRNQEASGFRELASTPLLLALICLAFDDSLSFPKRRVELYQEAVDALLKKWDSSRGVFRSEAYQRLSLDRKKQLLSRLAAQNFEEAQYFFAKDKLLLGISSYLASLPRDDMGVQSDPSDVLTAIEAQHGLLVERAYKIYSFSHLTLQEFFTARFIIENQLAGTLDRLIVNANEHSRWREVFLMTASMLDDATSLLEGFVTHAAKKILERPRLQALINYLADHRNPIPLELLASAPTYVSLNLSDRTSFAAPEKLLDAVRTLVGELSVGHYGEASEALTRAREISRLITGACANKPHAPIEKLAWLVMTEPEDYEAFAAYLRSCQLMVEALRLSMLDRRKAVEDMVLRLQ